MYEANHNAWTVSDLWNKWLLKVDHSMKLLNRKILLLCDNCASHKTDVKLTNIKLTFQPPNAMSLIQPLDMGIIANFKRHYKSLMLRQLISVIDTTTEGTAAQIARKLSLLDALHIVKQGWNRIETTTIANSFRHASFVKERPVDANSDITLDETIIYKPDDMNMDEIVSYVSLDNGVATERDEFNALTRLV